LVSVVDLLPHVQIVVRSRIEFKWDSSDPVEHQIRPEHVRNVRQCPGCLLRNTRDDIVEDLQAGNDDDVNSPCTFCIDPVGIQVWKSSLITHMFYGLRRLLVQQTTRPSPPARPLFAHGWILTARAWRFRARVVGDGARK